MVDILGNKLKITSIDIIPSNINHHNEYLMISNDESKYELVDKNNLIQQLNISYSPTSSINNYIESIFKCNNNSIIFNISEENPLDVTFGNQIKKTFTSINSIKVENNNQLNIFLNEDGVAYTLNNKIFYQCEEPLNMSENDVWFDISHEPLKIYMYKDSKWEVFYDVYLGKTNFNNEFINDDEDIPVIINTINKNNTVKNIFDDIIIDDIVIKQPITKINHDLNLSNVYDYTSTAILKCIADNCGYKVDDIIPINSFISINEIGCSNFSVVNKESNVIEPIDINCWKLKFIIRKL